MAKKMVSPSTRRVWRLEVRDDVPPVVVVVVVFGVLWLLDGA